VYIARRIETIIFDKKFFEKINRLPNRLVGIDQRTIKAASSFFVQFFNGFWSGLLPLSLQWSATIYF